MTISPTDTPKRLSDVENPISPEEISEWFGDEIPMEVIAYMFAPENSGKTIGEMRAWTRKFAASRRAPPSQGKVEISEDGIYWTCKCGWRSTFLDLKCPGCGNGQPAIYAAITQALTESSGQGTDGTCCERMRDAVIEECAQAAMLNTMGPMGNDCCLETRDNLEQAIVGTIRALKSKQPSDTGVEK